jgi:hypothetical protein
MLCPVHDDELTAFFEPKSAGTIAGHDYYDIGYFNLVLLTYNDRHPWIPVTVRAYLDFVERRMTKGQSSSRTQLAQNATRRLDESSINKIYEEMKKCSPEKAAEYRKTIEAMKNTMNQNMQVAQKELGSYDVEVQKEIDALKKFRAGLSQQQLEQQAVLGSGEYNLCLNGGCSSARALVQLDPDFIPWAKDRRIKLIAIRFIKDSKQDGWSELVKETVETLNYEKLKGLMK